MDPKALPDSPIPAFIPDLCHRQSVLRILLATQLFALLMTLVHTGPRGLDWEYLALTSLFMHWVTLSAAGLLCASQGFFRQWHPRHQAAAAYALLLCITALFAMLAEVIRLQPWQSEYPDRWNLLSLNFILYCVAISAILGAIGLRYLYLQHQRYCENQAGLEARLQALQARIKPHFLFNSMNSIAELISTQPDVAEEAVLDLAELFRASLSEEAALTTLDQEIRLCQSYVRMEGLRLGPRLQVEWSLPPDTLTCQIPPLCLQPLVENAIYHGIQPNPAGGKLEVLAYRREKTLYLEVRNPLPPTDPDGGRVHQGNRMALNNIRHRFDQRYGGEAAVKTSRQEKTFTAILRIPQTPDREAD